MRIFLSTDTVGGVWDYTVALAGELRGRGHDVLLAVIGRAGRQRLNEVPDGVEVVCRDYRLEWMPGAEEDLSAAGDWLADASIGWGSDLVHLNQMAYAVHDFRAPTLVVVHSDVLSWYSETLGRPAPPEWRRYRELIARGLTAADVIVTPSTYQSSLIRRHYGRAADHVIHNGVRPPVRGRAASERSLILSAGRCWDEAKGMGVVDRAAGMVEGSAGPIHVLGDLVGPHGQAFRPVHARCVGRLPRGEVDQWMDRARIYVGASLYEPFGLAPLEAALRGCVLLLSDIPSFRELWDGCAVFFPREDAAGLARALAELAGDEAARHRLAEAARERALARYTIDRLTTDYLRVYGEMLAPAGPANERSSMEGLAPYHAIGSA